MTALLLPRTTPLHDHADTAESEPMSPQAYRDLLASLSHDLRNPLTRIRAGAQLLDRRLRRPETVDREVLRAGLAQIEAATTKMATLLDDLMDASLLRAGEPLGLVRSPTDLVQLARHMAAQYQQTTERHELRVLASETSLVGVWDPTRIERVLSNLLSNAIKFSPAGGEILVSLVLQGEAVQEWAVREWAVLRVRDHGVGIPVHDLPRILDRFHRGHNVVGRVAGTGLGLAGVRQIVEQHGGTISVDSQEGAGATFKVRLPLAREEDAESSPAPERMP